MINVFISTFALPMPPPAVAYARMLLYYMLLYYNELGKQTSSCHPRSGAMAVYLPDFEVVVLVWVGMDSND